jgi:hypothetical protein
MVQIIENPQLILRTQFRFPRSKKKRIRKKWSKNTNNYKSEPDPNCYKIGNIIYCHPWVARIMKEKIALANRTN